MPNGHRPGGRCLTSANLGGWLGITRQLLDPDFTRWPRWGLRRGITCEPRRLIVHMLLLFSMAGRRGRSMILALRLLRLGRRTGAKQESINRHFSLCYHFGILMGLNCLWLSWLGCSFRLFNEYVNLTALRHAFSRLVFHWGTVLRSSVTRAKIPSFTSGR